MYKFLCKRTFLFPRDKCPSMQSTERTAYLKTLIMEKSAVQKTDKVLPRILPGGGTRWWEGGGWGVATPPPVPPGPARLPQRFFHTQYHEDLAP